MRVGNNEDIAAVLRNEFNKTIEKNGEDCLTRPETIRAALELENKLTTLMMGINI